MHFYTHLLLLLRPSVQWLSIVNFTMKDAKSPPKWILREFHVSRIRPRPGGLPHLETFTWQILTPAERVTRSGRPRALSIQPKIPVISVGTSNGTDHFGLVRPEYSGPALKVVHCDRSGHFGRSDRNVPFHLPKLLSPVPLFSILLTRTSSFQWKVKCCE